MGPGNMGPGNMGPGRVEPNTTRWRIAQPDITAGHPELAAAPLSVARSIFPDHSSRAHGPLVPNPATRRQPWPRAPLII